MGGCIMVQYNSATNDYATSRIIVSQTPGQGNFTTIAAAVAAATSAASAGSVIFLMPGIYVENITMRNGVNFAAYAATGEYGDPNVIITGKFIDNGVAVNCSLNNIGLQNNGDYVMSLSAGSSVQLVDCDVNAVNHAALNMTNSLANIYLYQCTGNVNTTGIGFYSISAGDLWVHESQLTNFGGTTTASSTSSGSVTMYDSQIDFPLACTSAGAYFLQNCIIDTAVLNAAAVTLSGNQTSTFSFCSMSTGTASCIISNTGTVALVAYNIYTTSNTYALAS
jgi:hypothetical protein